MGFNAWFLGYIIQALLTLEQHQVTQIHNNDSHIRYTASIKVILLIFVLQLAKCVSQ